MSVPLEDLSVAALKDLGRVQDLPGHTDMTRAELLDGLDGPVPDSLAQWLGKPRREVYEAAKAAGVEGAMDMQKAELLRALGEG